MNIQSAKDIQNNKKIKIMLHGPSAAGKTRLLKTLPEKALILNSDKGLRTIAGAANLDFFDVSSWSEAEEFLNYIKTAECKEKYSWIVFDSVNALADIKLRDLVEIKKIEGFKVWDKYGSFVLSLLMILRDQESYNTICIFASTPKTTDQGITIQTYGIQGNMVGLRPPEFFDEVFAVKQDKDGKRVIQTNSANGLICKDRSEKLLPIEDADLSKILAKIKG